MSCILKDFEWDIINFISQFITEKQSQTANILQKELKIADTI